MLKASFRGKRVHRPTLGLDCHVSVQNSSPETAEGNSRLCIWQFALNLRPFVKPIMEAFGLDNVDDGTTSNNYKIPLRRVDLKMSVLVGNYSRPEHFLTDQWIPIPSLIIPNARDLPISLSGILLWLDELVLKICRQMFP